MKSNTLEAELARLKTERRKALRAFYGRESNMLKAYNGIVKDVTRARIAIDNLQGKGDDTNAPKK